MTSVPALRRRRLLGLLACMPALGSCLGSIGSRVVEADPFGWPLFAAVAGDARLVAGEGSCKTEGLWPFAILSLPLDLLLDVVLLPVDVVAGVAGCRKRASEYFPAEQQEK